MASPSTDLPCMVCVPTYVVLSQSAAYFQDHYIWADRLEEGNWYLFMLTFSKGDEQPKAKAWLSTTFPTHLAHSALLLSPCCRGRDMLEGKRQADEATAALSDR